MVGDSGSIVRWNGSTLIDEATSSKGPFRLSGKRPEQRLGCRQRWYTDLLVQWHEANHLAR